MQTSHKQPIWLSTPSKLRDLLTRVGCWAVFWSQFLLVEGLLNIPVTANPFAVVFLAIVLLLLALFELFEANLARDLIDLTLYSFIYWFVLWISYEMGLSLYHDLAPFRDLLARFVFLISFLRLFWAFKVPNTDAYYAWPIIGPISGFFGKKSDEPIIRSRWHSWLVYFLILSALIYAAIGIWPQHTADIKKALGGLLGFYLFFKYYRTYMQGNIALVEENIQYRTSEEKLASLIMTVQSQAGGKLNPELIKTMCHFAQLDDRTQLILAATIADVAKSIMLPANQSTYDDAQEPPPDR
jgi:hypothetical protein